MIALVTWSGLPDLATDDRLLRVALERRGFRVDALAWDDPRAAWRDYAAVVLRSTWDYHKRFDEFRAWLDSLDGARIWNPPAVLRRNIHKSYLLELAKQGIDIVPTILIRRGESLPAIPWDDVIVKPAVSATAYRTVRGTAHLAELAQQADVLVQPFVEEIQRDGELSFIFLGRAFSHAMRKRPSGDDFRVQNEFGGSAVPFDPPPHLIAQALAIANTGLGEQWLYARVDCVERDGRLMLMELEATEPSLFLDAVSAERFADAIAVLT
jgi:glutathione synthase/RimK-type ligase-like ATP-grasp enzyme